MFKKLLQKLFSRNELRQTLYRISGPKRVVFVVATGLLIGSAIFLLHNVWESSTESRPTFGGEMTEAFITPPTLINPVLATSETDTSLVSLVFSGMVRKDEAGMYALDVASDVSVSDDGTVYEVSLNPRARFHDGVAVTADDILFTVNLVQNPRVRSPHQVDWQGVTVEAVDNLTLRFTLSQPFVGFIDSLTLGIVPKHLLENIEPDELHLSPFNLDPVGSGPYSVHSVSRSSDGVPRRIRLHANRSYVLGVPFIRRYTVSIYDDQQDIIDGVQSGDIDMVTGVSTLSLESLRSDHTTITSAPIDRLFGLFFNMESDSVLQYPEVREAVVAALDTDDLLSELFSDYIMPTDSILPPSLQIQIEDEEEEISTEQQSNVRDILEASGWRFEQGSNTRINDDNEEKLEFTIATPSQIELEQLAQALASQLRSNGISVFINTIDRVTLSDILIRERDFDALLFGYSYQHDTNLYAYWHSSQIEQPGLNITGFNDEEVDGLLSEALATPQLSERIELYRQAETRIQEQHPVVMLYAPHLTVVYNNNASLVFPDIIKDSHDRYTHIMDWYIDTRRILSL